MYTDINYMVIAHIILRWGGMIGPISGIVLFEVVYINKWNTPLEVASWLHEPASMYEVTPSYPINTEGVLLNSFSGITEKQKKP